MPAIEIAGLCLPLKPQKEKVEYQNNDFIAGGGVTQQFDRGTRRIKRVHRLINGIGIAAAILIGL